MLLNASRFDACISENGKFIPMAEQDRSKWDLRLINTGLQHLDKTTDFCETINPSEEIL